MSRSCHSATFSSAASALVRSSRASPQMLLGQLRVALVRHRARALLALARTAPPPPGSRCAAARGSRARSSPATRPAMASVADELGVAVALHDLGRDRLGARGRGARQTSSSISGATWAKLPTAPESLPTEIASRARRSRSRFRAGLHVPHGDLEPEGRGLGVDTVGAAHRQGVAVPEGQRRQRRAQPLQARDQQIGGLAQLQRQSPCPPRRRRSGRCGRSASRRRAAPRGW